MADLVAQQRAEHRFRGGLGRGVATRREHGDRFLLGDDELARDDRRGAVADRFARRARR